MPGKKKSTQRNPQKRNWPYDFRTHSTYAEIVSTDRVLTRSQTCLARIRNSPSDMQLFADPSRYDPPGHPHLMVTMKGVWGSIPTTYMSREIAKQFPISEDLCDRLELYKTFQPAEEPIQEFTEGVKKRTRKKPSPKRPVERRKVVRKRLTKKG